jgi:hypothetical protein
MVEELLATGPVSGARESSSRTGRHFNHHDCVLRCTVAWDPLGEAFDLMARRSSGGVPPLTVSA